MASREAPPSFQDRDQRWPFAEEALWENDIYPLTYWEHHDHHGRVSEAHPVDDNVHVHHGAEPDPSRRSAHRNNTAPCLLASRVRRVTDVNDHTNRNSDETELHESYWPNIERYLATRSSSSQGPRPVVVVRCVICQVRDIVVEGLQQQPPSRGAFGRAWRRHDDSHEDMVLLGCGHVVGRACWHRWRFERELGLKPVTCPICKQGVE